MTTEICVNIDSGTGLLVTGVAFSSNSHTEVTPGSIQTILMRLLRVIWKHFEPVLGDYIFQLLPHLSGSKAWVTAPQHIKIQYLYQHSFSNTWSPLNTHSNAKRAKVLTVKCYPNCVDKGDVVTIFEREQKGHMDPQQTTTITNTSKHLSALPRLCLGRGFGC